MLFRRYLGTSIVFVVFPRDWTLAGGVTRRVKLFLKKFDWVVQAPFRWHHAALNVAIDLSRAHLVANCDEILHHLRESWRRKQWTFFTQQNRRDSQNLRQEEYDATRCRMARLRASLGNIHEVACLTGAFVSPMRFSVMTRGRSNGRCPVFVIISMAQKNMFCGIALRNFRYLINQITSWSVS